MTTCSLRLSNGEQAPPQAQVRLLRRDSVLPASPSPPQSFFLSCFDIFWQDIHYNRRLLFYPPQPRTNEEVDEPVQQSPIVKQLKSSLAECLVYYYPWCGRLAKPADPPHRLFIDCNDAGVEFVEASFDVPISLLQEDGFQMKDVFDSLCQRPEHKGDCLFSSPLLSIQATFFSDGGLALGIAQSHVVADGQSLWDFMVSWGECARRVAASRPPVIDRRMLELPDPSLEKATWSFNFNPIDEDEEGCIADRDNSGDGEKGRSAQVQAAMPADERTRDQIEGKIEAAPPSAANTTGDEAIASAKPDDENGSKQNEPAENGREMDPKPELVQWIFTLPASTIKKLKSEAGEGFSSFEAICAHFWQRVTVARNAPPMEITKIFIPINCRSRLRNPVPRAYFGNVICGALIVSRAHKICSEALASTATRIRRELAAVGEGTLDALMHWLETHDNRFVNSLKEPRPVMKGLNVASSPHFPAYQVDFGWGKPAAVRAVKVTGDGELVLFGGRPGSHLGDVEICTALPADTLKRLLEDPLFVGQSPRVC